MFDALEGEQYGTSFGRENGTVILNAMTVAVINENCCYRDPLGVFRTVSVEWDVSWESISYGEILIVVCDGVFDHYNNMANNFGTIHDYDSDSNNSAEFCGFTHLEAAELPEGRFHSPDYDIDISISDNSSLSDSVSDDHDADVTDSSDIGTDGIQQQPTTLQAWSSELEKFNISPFIGEPGPNIILDTLCNELDFLQMIFPSGFFDHMTTETNRC